MPAVIPYRSAPCRLFPSITLKVLLRLAQQHLQVIGRVPLSSVDSSASPGIMHVTASSWQVAHQLWSTSGSYLCHALSS